MRVPTDQGKKKDGLEDTVSSWGGAGGGGTGSLCPAVALTVEQGHQAVCLLGFTVTIKLIGWER